MVMTDTERLILKYINYANLVILFASAIINLVIAVVWFSVYGIFFLLFFVWWFLDFIAGIIMLIAGIILLGFAIMYERMVFHSLKKAVQTGDFRRVHPQTTKLLLIAIFSLVLGLGWWAAPLWITWFILWINKPRFSVKI